MERLTQKRVAHGAARALAASGICAVASALFLGVGVGTALAHAQYVSSTPANRSIVDTAPTRVVAKFSEGVRPAGSSMRVIGPDGSRADNADSAVDTTDATRTTMTVSLKSGLNNGTYVVAWTTVSADDGNTASGAFSFSIGAPSFNAALPRTGGPALGLALPMAAGGLLLTAVGGVLRHWNL